MPYIYKITNLINGKEYIGKTMKTVEERWKSHKKDSQKRRHEKRPLYDAMNKYGIDNFSITTVEECTAENLNDREQYWIKYYDTYKNGYNATYGGDGISYIDHKQIIALYQEKGTIKEVSRITGHDPGWISQILKNNNIEILTCSEVARRKSRTVAKLDIETEEILETYESLADAERANGNTQHIGDVCRGKRKTCKGYKWKFI